MKANCILHFVKYSQSLFHNDDFSSHLLKPHFPKQRAKKRKEPNHVLVYQFNLKKLKSHLDFHNIAYTYKVKHSNLFYNEHSLGSSNKLTYAQLQIVSQRYPTRLIMTPKGTLLTWNLCLFCNCKDLHHLTENNDKSKKLLRLSTFTENILHSSNSQ